MRKSSHVQFTGLAAVAQALVWFVVWSETVWIGFAADAQPAGYDLLHNVQLTYEPDKLLQNASSRVVSSVAECGNQCLSSSPQCWFFVYSANGTCLLLGGITGASKVLDSTSGVLTDWSGAIPCRPVVVQLTPASQLIDVLQQVQRKGTNLNYVTLDQIRCFNNLETWSDLSSNTSLIVPTDIQCLPNDVESCYSAECTGISGFSWQGLQSLNNKNLTYLYNQSDCCTLCRNTPDCYAWTINSGNNCSLYAASALFGYKAGSSTVLSGLRYPGSCPTIEAVKAGTVLVHHQFKSVNGEKVSGAAVCCFNSLGTDDCQQNLEQGINVAVPCSNVTSTQYCHAAISDSHVNTTALAVGLSVGLILGLPLLAVLAWLLWRNNKKRRFNRLNELLVPGSGKSGIMKFVNDKASQIGGDKYEWVEEGYRGANSFVVLGLHKLSNRSVAAKFFNQEEGFRRETMLLRTDIARKHRPEVFDMFEHVSERDYLYVLVMEKGDYTVEEWLQRSEARPNVLQSKAMLRDLSDALTALHESSTMHGDIKPSNIMWFSRDHKWKLIDFATWGKFGEPAQPHYSLRYSAPEAVSASRAGSSYSAGGAADMWSLGVIAWACFVGEPLFGSQYADSEVRDMLLGKQPLPFERHEVLWLAVTDEPARHLIQNLLKREPDERWSIFNVVNSPVFQSGSDTVMKGADFESLVGMRSNVQQLLDRVHQLREINSNLLQNTVTPALMVCINFQQVRMPRKLSKKLGSFRSKKGLLLGKSSSRKLKNVLGGSSFKREDSNGSEKYYDAPSFSFKKSFSSHAIELVDRFPSAFSNTSFVTAADGEQENGDITPFAVAEGEVGSTDVEAEIAQMYVQAAAGRLAVDEAPLSMMAIFGGEEEAVVQLHVDTAYVIRLSVMCGTVESIEVPISTCSHITISYGNDGAANHVNIQQLPSTSNSHNWEGFGIWRTDSMPLGPTQLDITMVFMLKAARQEVCVHKMVPVLFHPLARSLAAEKTVQKVKSAWKEAPEWVKLAAHGLTFFAETYKAVKG